MNVDSSLGLPYYILFSIGKFKNEPFNHTVTIGLFGNIFMMPISEKFETFYIIPPSLQPIFDELKSNKYDE
jgi:hypothetical protein